jgi:hypothetical protein
MDIDRPILVLIIVLPSVAILFIWVAIDMHLHKTRNGGTTPRGSAEVYDSDMERALPTYRPSRSNPSTRTHELRTLSRRARTPPPAAVPQYRPARAYWGRGAEDDERPDSQVSTLAGSTSGSAASVSSLSEASVGDFSLVQASLFYPEAARLAREQVDARFPMR